MKTVIPTKYPGFLDILKPWSVWVLCITNREQIDDMRDLGSSNLMWEIGSSNCQLLRDLWSYVPGNLCLFNSHSKFNKGCNFNNCTYMCYNILILEELKIRLVWKLDCIPYFSIYYPKKKMSYSGHDTLPFGSKTPWLLEGIGWK